VAVLTRTSHTLPVDVAQALVPAVSRLISTPVRCDDTVSERSVGMSADAAGKSACATSLHPKAGEKCGLTTGAEILLALLVVNALVVNAPVVNAQGQTADEYQVKAAYMYNFAKFVDWPAKTFDSPAQAIVFCVLGQTPLSQPLEDALAGKVVDQRPLVFRQLADSKQAGKCQVLFLGSLDKKQMRQTLDEVKSFNLLTVGEVEDFTNAGGVIRFVLDAGRVRLEFNLDAADEAKLRISSKLLSLGKTMRTAGK
jgi:hypothetical protein